MLIEPGSRPSFAPLPEVPGWAGEVALQIRMGWTEKQLREENTALRLRQIAHYLETEARAERARAARARARASMPIKHK